MDPNLIQTPMQPPTDLASAIKVIGELMATVRDLRESLVDQNDIVNGLQFDVDAQQESIGELAGGGEGPTFSQVYFAKVTGVFNASDAAWTDFDTDGYQSHVEANPCRADGSGVSTDMTLHLKLTEQGAGTEINEVGVGSDRSSLTAGRTVLSWGCPRFRRTRRRRTTCWAGIPQPLS